MSEPCGARLSLAKEIIVNCALGNHQNRGYHQGPLGIEWVRYDVRWSPIGIGGPADVHLIPRTGVQR